MRMHLATAAVSAVFLMAATAANADCPEGAAGTSQETTASIAKDGTIAPMETAESKAAEGSAMGGTTTNPQQAGNQIAKDGSTMPLAAGEGGGEENLATSPQDVQAQQEGEKTAAATAREGCVE